MPKPKREKDQSGKHPNDILKEAIIKEVDYLRFEYDIEYANVIGTLDILKTYYALEFLHECDKDERIKEEKDTEM